MAKIDLGIMPDPEVLRNLLKYDPESGKLYWKERGIELFEHCGNPSQQMNAWNAQYVGKEALATVQDAWGCLSGEIFNRKMRASRVIWAMTYGEWPEADVMHRNGDPTDNRIENLTLRGAA